MGLYLFFLITTWNRYLYSITEYSNINNNKLNACFLLKHNIGDSTVHLDGPRISQSETVPAGRTRTSGRRRLSSSDYNRRHKQSSSSPDYSCKVVIPTHTLNHYHEITSLLCLSNIYISCPYFPLALQSCLLAFRDLQ